MPKAVPFYSPTFSWLLSRRSRLFLEFILSVLVDSSRINASGTFSLEHRGSDAKT